MKDDNCIFCKIANGVIPSATIYEDDDFRAVLDTGPATRGHALLLPKEHFSDLYGLDDDYCGKVFKVAKKIGTRMKEKLNADGLNIVQNNGAAAGQTVFHFHVHMIPRYKDDGAGIAWKPGKLDDEARDELVKLLS